MKNSGRMATAIIISLMLSLAIPVYAGIVLPGSNNDLQVAYRGTEGEFLVFIVSVENNNSKRKTINITDENGRQLFNQVFYEEKVSRKFKIPKGEIQKLTFSLQQSQGISSKTFVISTKYIERTEVEEQ
ncbi:MAG: hypothetical protein QM731_09305 [Chitinophagaceae bacterium]